MEGLNTTNLSQADDEFDMLEQDAPEPTARLYTALNIQEDVTSTQNMEQAQQKQEPSVQDAAPVQQEQKTTAQSVEQAQQRQEPSVQDVAPVQQEQKTTAQNVEQTQQRQEPSVQSVTPIQHDQKSAAHNREQIQQKQASSVPAKILAAATTAVNGALFTLTAVPHSMAHSVNMVAKPDSSCQLSCYFETQWANKLKESARTGDLDEIKRLLARFGGLKPEFVNHRGSSSVCTFFEYKGPWSFVSNFFRPTRRSNSAWGSQTALMLATENRHYPIVEYLLDQPNISLDAKDNWGWTALDYAKRNGDQRLITILETAQQARLNNAQQNTNNQRVAHIV